MGMARDLQAFLAELEGDPEELVRVRRPVRPHAFEVTAILEHLDRRRHYPVVLFEQPENLRGEPSGFRLASNLFGTRARIAHALAFPRDQDRMPLSLEYARRFGQRVPARPAHDGVPAQEVVHRGEQADFALLPVVRHYELDLSPVLTMAVALKDPDEGFYDISFAKLFPKGPRRAGISIHTPHLERILQKYYQRQQPCPAVVIVGHHPALYLCALALNPFGINDYDAVGAYLGEPLRLAPSVTWGEGFWVPADAEILLEGFIPPNEPEVVDPFGEVTRFYQPQCIRQAFELTAITHRRQAIYQDVFSGHAEHWNLGGIPREGSMYQSLNRKFGNVTGVHFPHSGCSRLLCYISVRKRQEGEVKAVGLAALTEAPFLNCVVLVDAEIDVFNEPDVIWAVLSYTDPSRDVDILRNVYNLFNTAAGFTKVIIDATRPLDVAFPAPFKVPDEVMERIRLEEWLEVHGAHLLG